MRECRKTKGIYGRVEKKTTNCRMSICQPPLLTNRYILITSYRYIALVHQNY